MQHSRLLVGMADTVAMIVVDVITLIIEDTWDAAVSDK